MSGFERRFCVRNGLFRRATAMAAATALIYMPLLAYAPVAHADTTISTNTTGGNGGNGGNGQYVLNPGPPTGGSAGTGGAAGDSSGTAPTGGAGSTNYAYPTGGGGGGSDGGGGGGGTYGSGAGGGGGGAGGVGATASSGVLTNNAILGGGDGGNGGIGGGDYYPQAGQYDEAGGGGGGGGGSGVFVSGGTSITNNGSILGGNGGGSGSGDGGGAYGGIGNSYYTFQNPVAAGNGYGGRGGNGITATSSTALTIINNGIITGGIGGADYQNAYGRYGGYRQQAGGTGILGQNLTITNNSGGTISAGQGIGTAYAIQLTGGTNSLTNSGTIGDIYAGANLSFQNNTGSVGNITLGGTTNNIAMLGGTAGHFNLYGSTTASGTFGSGVTLNSGATFLVTGADGTHDVSGITTFDNYGGLTVGTGRSISMSTFTNENGATLTLNNGSELIASTLNLLAGSTISGAGTLSSGSSALNFDSGSVSVNLGGTGGLVKNGTGTLTLMGANTYTGGTTVNDGTLSIAENTLGGGDVTLAQGTTIQFTGTSFTTTNNFHITGDPIFDVASGTTQTVSGVIDDATGPTNPGVVEKTGTGQLILSGANTYSGGTAIKAGVLQVGVATVGWHGAITSSAIGTGTLTLDGGTLQAGGNSYTIANDIALGTNSGSIDGNGQYFILSGDITGSTGITFVDTASLANSHIVLSGNNTYSATTTINSGTVHAGSDTALSANSDYVVNGSSFQNTPGRLDLNGFSSTIRSLSGDADGGIANWGSSPSVLTIAPASGTTTFAGTVMDGGTGLTLALVMNGASGARQILSGDNTYIGGTTISGGILGVDNNNALGTGTVTLDGGTLEADGGFTLNNTIAVNNTGGTIDANSQSLFLVGGIANGTNGNAGTLTFTDTSGTGNGLIVLEGTSSYGGAVVIDSGVTVGEGAMATLPGGAYTVNGNLDVSAPTQISSLTGSGTVDGIFGGGTLSVNQASGTSTFSGTLDDNGTNPLSLVKAGAGTMNLSGTNTFSGGTTLSAGTIGALNSSALGSGGVTLNGGTLVYGNTVNLANAITLTGDSALEVDGTDVATQSGVIGDNGSAHTLQKLGSGTLQFTQANNYSGIAKLTAGTLEIGNAGALGSSTLLFDGGTLKVDGAYTIANDIQIGSNVTGSINTGTFDTVLSGTISDVGVNDRLEIGGTGTVTITGQNDTTGGTQLDAGATLVAASGQALGSGAVALGTGSTLGFTNNSSSFANDFTLNGDPTYDVGAGLTTTLTGVISDLPAGTPGVLEKAGTGTLALASANTYSGGTDLNAGTLRIDTDTVGTPGGITSSAIGTGTLTFGGGMLQAGGTFTVANAINLNTANGTVDANGYALTLSGYVSGTNGLILTDSQGGGSVTLADAFNSYSGNTVVNGVNVILTGETTGAHTGPLGDGSVVLNGGALQMDASGFLTNPIALDTNGGTLRASGGNAISFSGVISDYRSGAGGLTIGAPGDMGTVALSGNNSFTGGLTIAGGTLTAGSSTALGDVTKTVVMQDGATLAYNNGVTISNPLQWTGDVTLRVNSGVAGQLGGVSDDNPASAYTVTKVGAGTLTLSGTNNSSTNVTLAEGVLEIANQSALFSGNYTFDGGTLKVDGSWTIGNDIQVLSGGTFDTNGYNTELTGTLSSNSTGGALTITGSGSVLISGISNLSGGAAIDTNTALVVAGASGIGAGDVSMADSSTLHFTTTSGTFTNQFLLDGTASFNADSGLTATLNNVIADAPSAGSPGVLEKTGAGTLVLSGANTYSGGTTLTDGILRLDADTGLNGVSPLGTGTVTFNGGTLQAGGDYTYANSLDEIGGGTIDANGHQLSLTGSISGGTNGLTFVDSQGGGAVTVWDHNSYNGNVAINYATVIMAGNTDGAGLGPLGTGTITLEGGTLVGTGGSFISNDMTLGADGGTLRSENANGYGFGAISDAVGGGGALTIGAPGDTGAVNLSHDSTYTGGTIIAGGTLNVTGGTAALGTGIVEMRSGTTLGLNNNASLANGILLDDTTPIINVDSGSATLSGTLLENSGTPGGFTKTGTGTLALAGSNNYSNTSIQAGTLELQSNLSVVNYGIYDAASGASFKVDGGMGAVYIGALSGAGSLTVYSGTQLNVGGAGVNSDNTTFSGVINADYLAYDGQGTLTLSGTGSNIKQLIVCGCTSSGGITLSGGNLTAAIGVGVSGQTFTVADGAQLSTPDFEQSGGTIAINGAGTVVDATNNGSGLIAVYASAGQTPVFTVGDGAHVMGDTLMSGITSGTTAPQITVTGANSLLSLTSGMQLNNGASLTVAAGAALTTPSIDLDTNASLMVGGGAAVGTVGDANTRIQGLSSGTQVVANFTGSGTLDAFVTGAAGLSVQKGNLTLTNALNDYSGGTTIASGSILTLQNASAGTGAIANAGLLVIQNGAPSTFANALSGPGGLSQTGDGALTINTAQVYTGGTLVAPNSTLFLTGAGDLSRSSGIEADGTFDISGVTASSVEINKLLGDGDMEIGSKTLVVVGNGGVFSGILSDGGSHGSLTVLGNQVLNGVISLTGTTTLGAGATLTVSGPDALGGSALDFNAGSTLKFGGSGTYNNAMTFAAGAPVFDVTNQNVTLSGLLGGPGDLAVTGANGILMLTNTGNTYAGGTEVYGDATLNVGADGELGTPAALQLGDANTKGTLQYGASFALDGARAITLNAGGGAIDTNGFDAVITQAIGGTGSLAKLGAGTLTLAGANTFTGATTVSGGILRVNGSIASSAVTVASGGTLGGSGTVGATSVSSGGTIAPNGDTLYVNGTLTLANGATSAIAVTPAASGQIAATGAASLNGTLAISQGTGTYTAGSSFNVVTASSVSGTFATVTGTSFTGLDSSIVYSATGVTLDLSAPSGSGTGGGSGGGSSGGSGSGTGGGTGGGSSGGSGSGTGGGTGGGSSGGTGGGSGGVVITKFLFGTYGNTLNQVAAGDALAAGDPMGSLYVAMGHLVSTQTTSVPNALGQLSGDIHASIRSAMIEDDRIVRDTVLDHLRFAQQGTSIWGAGFYSNGGIDSDGNASELHHNSAGFLAGLDMPFGGGFRAGLAGGYVSNGASEPGHLSTADGSSGHIIAYGGWSDDALTFKLGADYGWGNMNVVRQVTMLSQTNRSRERQHILQLFGEAGYLIQMDAAQVEPYGDLVHISARTGGFTETGGLSALSGSARDDNATYATIGVHLSLSDTTLDSMRIVPRLSAGWQHALNRSASAQMLTLENASQSFIVQGASLQPDVMVIRAGLGIALSSDTTLDVGYDGAFSASSRDHGIRGELRWSF